MRDTPLEPLSRLVAPEGWSTRPVDLVAVAHDASHYLLTPSALVTPADLGELTAVLVAANRSRTPLTFRSGGTSLSGQAGTEGVLVDTRHSFSGVEVLDGGARVRCEPGAVLRRVNAMLARHGRRLGPDPASEIACTIGGVVANNSSGMTSSHTATAYRTLHSMRFVLPSGTVVDTAAPDASRRLAADEPALVAGLLAIRDRLRTDARLREIISHQFSMKNTMGYGLNAFLDHDEPADILAHLLVGSEGTLAYVASVVLDTVPALPHVATALAVFEDIDQAAAAVPSLLEAGAVAVELMDPPALRVAQGLAAAPEQMRAIAVESHTALLVEAQAASEPDLADAAARLSTTIAGLPLALPTALTTEAQARAAMWAVRKGLYAAVAAARPAGTTNLLEDIAFPADRLSAGVAGLGALLERYGYDEAVTFGHARDANLHFMITPHLDDARELATYEAFTEDLVELVLGEGGTLKAEHGTGRMMSPYVRRQYGPELYEVMREVKRLCDPHGILAPGVILDDDSRAHVSHLKTFPQVDREVDTCVECGYCEPGCPSRNTTTTPRQRIVLMREIGRARAEGRPDDARALERDFGYEAVQTCAADSLCVRSCPVSIDTGAVMKRQRAEGLGPLAQRGGAAVAGHWEVVESVARLGLGVADALPSALVGGASRLARRVLPTDVVPEVGEDLPGPGRSRSTLTGLVGPAEAEVVLFPSCTGALFGGPASSFLALTEAAGVAVTMPEQVDSLCCGTPWSSKGFVEGQRVMGERVVDALWLASREGALSVVMDGASCTHGLEGLDKVLAGTHAERFARLTVLDAVAWVRAAVLPRLTIPEHRRLDRVVVHPTCGTEHLGATADLVTLAEAAAREVVVPAAWGCCGFAGDRGLLHPELTAGATRDEAAEVAAIRD
ncbi:FAD-binding and (Fe-S)-binding domain-containing protein, partial [Pseudactinotalea sp.]|uniref:FAD-binding and (Fe-S)-binding domain-containing protein n=1 Tax=Pseudactinotalea sp. TaxID=1926260 RepID=UPI003B3A62CF